MAYPRVSELVRLSIDGQTECEVHSIVDIVGVKFHVHVDGKLS